MARDEIGHHTAVTVNKDNQITLAQADRAIARLGHAKTIVFVPVMFDRDRTCGGKILDDLCGFIARSIIGDDDLEIAIF